MNRSYLKPSIEAHDFSKFQFAKNQATCPSLTLDLGTPGAVYNGSQCGTVDSEFVAAFCLSESVDPSILVDLVLNFNVGEGAHTITSCSPPASVNGCNALYFCNVTPDFDGPACLIDIRCSDGTLIDSCTGQSSCFLT